jgi:eukaryotic-like serine/threonine-protein kinase
MRYRAFLSYSHADARWARWLLRRLESYRVPRGLVGAPGRNGPIPARLGSFFRDRDELPSAGDLSSAIKAALDESAAMVVLCSPAAAKSRWVNAEIAAFRSTDRGDQILCFVVDGDPEARDSEHACIPPALLLPDGAGAPPREPLAADARRAGDGRERAFIKLVAGLLGVGYGELAPREAQRRNRRLVLITAASLSGMIVALALAASAYVARNDAQRRQLQTEDILGFMLGDLRKKLSTVGRLDLMRVVDDKATTYFATLDPHDLTDRTLEAQARSLIGIGQVRLDEGHLRAAMAAFREAHARSLALYQRQPGNGQRLFDLAQAQYWIGLVMLNQGGYGEAGVWFRKYRDSAIKLAAMDRDNFDWQKEVAWGRHNLAVLDERQGRYEEAEREMRGKRELYRDWLLQRPQDQELRFEDADAASWLGSISARQGKLADAEAFFAEQSALMSRNVADDPTNARWKELEIDALIFQAGTQVMRGRLAEASAAIEAARPRADALARQDPANNGWQVTAGICRWWQAQLATAAHLPMADELAAEAAKILADALAVEPENERVLRSLAQVRNLQAERALLRGDAAVARSRLAEAAALLDPAWNSHRNETLRLVLAKTRLLLGEAAQLGGDRDGALVFWRQAEQLLVANAGAALPFERLDPMVRTLSHLGRDEEAQTLRQRLDAAGYVPLLPFPPVDRIAARWSGATCRCEQLPVLASTAESPAQLPDQEYRDAV